MNTLQAFMRAQSAVGNPIRVFDWHKAVELIKEKQAKNAVAGLQSDMEWTGGDILVDGQIFMDGYTYLASNWAIPVLGIDGIEYPCWVWMTDSDGWDCDTKWPQSARDMLTEE